MFATLVSVACLAPVPTHLMPPAPPPSPVPNHPAVPGFRWWYCDYELESLGVIDSPDGPDVIYRCVSHPGKTWAAVVGPGCSGLSWQSLARTWQEASDHPPRPRLTTDHYQPFTLVPP